MMPRERSTYTRRSHLRDPSLIVIACEGCATEPQYFSGLAEKILERQSSKLKVHILDREANLSAPSHVLNQLKDYKRKLRLKKGDLLCMVIDKDQWEDRMLSQVAQECHQSGFMFLVSNPCFEVWLLAHFEGIEGIDPEECNKVTLRRKIISHTGSFNPSALQFTDFEDYIDQAIENSERSDIDPALRWPDPVATRVHLLVNEIKSHLD